MLFIKDFNSGDSSEPPSGSCLQLTVPKQLPFMVLLPKVVVELGADFNRTSIRYIQDSQTLCTGMEPLGTSHREQLVCVLCAKEWDKGNSCTLEKKQLSHPSLGAAGPLSAAGSVQLHFLSLMAYPSRRDGVWMGVKHSTIKLRHKNSNLFASDYFNPWSVLREGDQLSLAARTNVML